jgi:hypothetical protein
MSSIRVVAEFQSPAITQAVIESVAGQLQHLKPDIERSRDGNLWLSCVVTAASNDLAVRYLLKRIRATLAEVGVHDATVMTLLVEAEG